ncbi:MAG: hypothetical protein BWX86_00545 [Verrucomicrobia bacterium ADurb.Bin122]|nr:MAG: hypothetical protein BWX86_00545 [Verrucomicrobia bacterium ADurb.Bin122]
MTETYTATWRYSTPTFLYTQPSGDDPSALGAAWEQFRLEGPYNAGIMSAVPSGLPAPWPYYKSPAAAIQMEEGGAEPCSVLTLHRLPMRLATLEANGYLHVLFPGVMSRYTVEGWRYGVVAGAQNSGTYWLGWFAITDVIGNGITTYQIVAGAMGISRFEDGVETVRCSGTLEEMAPGATLRIDYQRLRLRKVVVGTDVHLELRNIDDPRYGTSCIANDFVDGRVGFYGRVVSRPATYHVSANVVDFDLELGRHRRRVIPVHRVINASSKVRFAATTHVPSAWNTPIEENDYGALLIGNDEPVTVIDADTLLIGEDPTGPANPNLFWRSLLFGDIPGTLDPTERPLWRSLLEW